MKPLFDMTNLESLDRKSLYPFECEHCKNIFYEEGKWIQCKLLYKTYERKFFRFCSTSCSGLANIKYYFGNCTQCNLPIKIRLSDKRKSKSGNMFCNRSCAGTYNNVHKTTGTRRSKLECWIESELTILFPDLDILYNKVLYINNELDIFIPKLKLAIEINGIFHYKPIYGEDKFLKTVSSDLRKKINCIKNDITLIIIDVSNYKAFKITTAKPFLKAIVAIISAKKIAPEEVFETPT